METTKIRLGGKEYNVLVARTEEEREQGLQNVESMEADEGCLFIHPEVGHVDYWMVDTDIPLSIIFIGEDKEVISVQEGVPNTEDYISEDNVKYVVELNAGADVEPRDILEIDGEDDFSDEEISMDPNKMYIIGSDGKPITISDLYRAAELGIDTLEELCEIRTRYGSLEKFLCLTILLHHSYHIFQVHF